MRDPAGFSLALPDGFTRRTDGPRIFSTSPDGSFRVGTAVRAVARDRT